MTAQSDRYLQGERLARVEEQVDELRKKVDSMDIKLDALLALRNKGAGVFWFLSVVVGTGLVSLVYQIMTYFRGH